MNGDDHLHGKPRPTPEQVAWVFHHLIEHYGEGGSFRHLIYERMGFDESAYGVLCGQGMNLSNLGNCARDNREVGQAMLDCYLDRSRPMKLASFEAIVNVLNAAGVGSESLKV